MSRLKVAIIDEELPFPLTSGKRIRTYGLLSRLAAKHDITYIAYRGADSDAAANEMQRIGIKAVLVDHQLPKKSGLQFPFRLAMNLLSPRPYSVDSHVSNLMRQAIDKVRKEQTIDVWHCEWTPYAEFMRGLVNVRWLVVAHNVESQIWRRYEENERNRLKRWYIAEQRRKFEHFECWAVQSAHATVAVSEVDAAFFRETFAARNVQVVDNGVDTEFFAPSPSAVRLPHRILFLGSLDWRPNQDGVSLLLKEIFPEVLRQRPTAELLVVGRHPPDWLRSLISESPQTTLAADVADVRPYMAQCGMLAVPLRIGGGSRLKILEALSTELPVVSTKIGAEGLHFEADRHLMSVDSVEEMPAAICRAIDQPEAMQKMASLARRHLLQTYDWNRLALKLEQIWLQVRDSAVVPLAE